MKTKSIDWSYPTSTNAKRFGFHDTGCWTVSTCELPSTPVALAGFATETEAVRYAEGLDVPWWAYSRHASVTRESLYPAFNYENTPPYVS